MTEVIMLPSFHESPNSPRKSSSLLKLIHPQTYNGVSNSTLFLDQEYSRNIHLSIQLAMLLFTLSGRSFNQSINQSIN